MTLSEQFDQASRELREEWLARQTHWFRVKFFARCLWALVVRYARVWWEGGAL
jgi:hypothetical protein